MMCSAVLELWTEADLTVARLARPSGREQFMISEITFVLRNASVNWFVCLFGVDVKAVVSGNFVSEVGSEVGKISWFH